MFQHFKNIDSAFKYIRVISILTILGSFVMCSFFYFSSRRDLERKDNRILVIANGKAFEAYTQLRGDVWPVEIRDHVKMFHFYLHTLPPDETSIKRNITKALYLADNSASKVYKNLLESGYYSDIIAANISQEIEMDSIRINTDASPWWFQYWGKLRITRTSAIITRSLVTEGTLRVLQQVSDNNPHGLLIENWKILENKDLKYEKR